MATIVGGARWMTAKDPAIAAATPAQTSGHRREWIACCDLEIMRLLPARYGIRHVGNGHAASFAPDGCRAAAALHEGEARRERGDAPFFCERRRPRPGDAPGPA